MSGGKEPYRLEENEFDDPVALSRVYMESKQGIRDDLGGLEKRVEERGSRVVADEEFSDHHIELVQSLTRELENEYEHFHPREIVLQWTGIPGDGWITDAPQDGVCINVNTMDFEATISHELGHGVYNAEVARRGRSPDDEVIDRTVGECMADLTEYEFANIEPCEHPHPRNPFGGNIKEVYAEICLGELPAFPEKTRSHIFEKYDVDPGFSHGIGGIMAEIMYRNNLSGREIIENPERYSAAALRCYDTLFRLVERGEMERETYRNEIEALVI